MSKRAKRPEPVRATFEAAGYPCEYNRRDRWFKALAELVDSGLLTFAVCTRGQAWFPKEGTKYNVRVAGFGREQRYYHPKARGDVRPYDVLRVAGKFLQAPEVRERVRAHVNLDLTCDRCGGQGYIPQFSYYCDGICFECYGSGFSRHKRTEVQLLGAVPESPTSNLTPR